MFRTREVWDRAHSKAEQGKLKTQEAFELTRSLTFGKLLWCQYINQQPDFQSLADLSCDSASVCMPKHVMKILQPTESSDHCTDISSMSDVTTGTAQIANAEPWTSAFSLTPMLGRHADELQRKNIYCLLEFDEL